MSPEKQRRADTDTEMVDRLQTRRAEPGAGRTGRRADADARRDSGKLRKNQERLGVGPEHKTEAMKKGHRGVPTFMKEQAMMLKLLGAATAAALLTLASVSFGQTPRCSAGPRRRSERRRLGQRRDRQRPQPV